jgi:uncharacterized protein YjbJ (UPF0337 family)
MQLAHLHSMQMATALRPRDLVPPSNEWNPPVPKLAARMLFAARLLQVRLDRKRQRTKPNRLMNTLQFKGNWNIAKGKLKKKYASLTDDDLRYTEGQEDELIGRIQKRTGDTKELVEQALRDSFANDNERSRR